ncbi:MAG: hemolysin family protein [Desulfovibrio sp.]|uniref:hemolysin family protein n=1 Tax=Desulfovibrio sp. 7SRBS1 TaxID=3378064 RepID=UPI003B3D7F4D
MLELILSVSLATLISFFCSVSEAALYSISWSRIESLRKKGRRSGKILYAMRRDVEKPISAILTLNTVANTAGASIAGAAAARVFGPDHLAWFAVGFTLVILLFAELIPKTLGVVYNKTAAPLLARPLQLLVLFCAPITWTLGFVVRLFKTSSIGPLATEEDVRALVSLTYKAGILKEYEELAIGNILSLDKKQVRDIMTPRTVVFSLPAHMSVAEAWQRKSVWPHSRIPVFEHDDREDIVGLVYRREVFEALVNDRDDLTLDKLMRPVEFVLETLTLDRLLIKFLKSRIHLIVVLDEYGGISGVVSLEDVLEEILGREIVDETDQVADMRELAKKKRKGLMTAAGQRESAIERD